MKKFKVKTPHAAIIVWNYKDRIHSPNDKGLTGSGVEDLLGVESKPKTYILSTLSCISIQTQKSKSQPDGSFNFVLAPTRNWVSLLTPGSWCCILMSGEGIKEEDLTRANRNKVKMLGRIETVRCETHMEDDGTRKTLYYVSGKDWGDIFNSNIYIDNLIRGPGDSGSQMDVAATAIRKILYKDGSGTPSVQSVANNLRDLIHIFGKDISPYTGAVPETGRMANSMYSFKLPPEVIKYFKLDKGSLDQVLKLVTGSLVSTEDKYDDTHPESEGYIDPFSLQGTHTLWQILLENSNAALNEMLTDFRWSNNNKVDFCVYNRIKPFCYQNDGQPLAVKRSYFKNVKTHRIDDLDVISVNAGTNWRDKFNFIEVKPQFQEFYIIENLTKQKSQAFDRDAFNREGFRPLIVDTKQFPTQANSNKSDISFKNIQWQNLQDWVKLMREWYFDTHRLLNGTLVMYGTTPYIGVGDNVRFDAGLINPTPNINKGTMKKGVNGYILAHIESISHTFTVDANGARAYRTVIQFVRGIVVNHNNSLLGDGALDKNATDVPSSKDFNTANTFGVSTELDPDRNTSK